MPFIHFLLFPIAALGGNKRIKNFSISTSINTLEATIIILQVYALYIRELSRRTLASHSALAAGEMITDIGRLTRRLSSRDSSRN